MNEPGKLVAAIQQMPIAGGSTVSSTRKNELLHFSMLCVNL